MEKTRDDKDILISVLMGQRNNLMDQITNLMATIEKMAPFMPVEPANQEQTNDDKPQ